MRLRGLCQQDHVVGVGLHTRPALHPTQHPMQWGLETPWGIRRLDCETDYSPQPSVYFNNAWSCSSNPAVSLFLLDAYVNTEINPPCEGTELLTELKTEYLGYVTSKRVTCWSVAKWKIMDCFWPLGLFYVSVVSFSPAG